MAKIDIAGLKIDALAKSELLDNISARMASGQKTWLTTPYSEFLRAALLDPSLMELLNRSDLAAADGIGLFWAARYLSIPLTAKSYRGKVLQGWRQSLYSQAAIIFNPRWIKSALPEKISGSDLIWDIAELAAENNLSIYLLGGYGDTPRLAAEKLENYSVCKNHGRERSTPGKPRISIKWSNKNPDDPTAIDDIQKAQPDILLVAFGPIKQEKWIDEHLAELPVKLIVGLGGTFDYLAGKRPSPPQFWRQNGLEWLWRLFTQPYRIGRITNATFGLTLALWRYKVFMSLPYRPNVISVVLNKNNEVLAALRNPEDADLRITGDLDAVKFKNYWQFSQGGVDHQEDLASTARRELAEELHIKNVELIKVSDHTTSYTWKNANRPFWFNKYHFKGQNQHIVYFRFTGRDEEIKVDNFEFIDFKWVPIGELEKVIHPEKINVLKIVEADLKEMAEKAII